MNFYSPDIFILMKFYLPDRSVRGARKIGIPLNPSEYPTVFEFCPSVFVRGAGEIGIPGGKVEYNCEKVGCLSEKKFCFLSCHVNT